MKMDEQVLGSRSSFGIKKRSARRRVQKLYGVSGEELAFGGLQGKHSVKVNVSRCEGCVVLELVGDNK